MTGDAQKPLWQQLREVRERVMGTDEGPYTETEVEGTLEDMLHLGEVEQVGDSDRYRLVTRAQLDERISDVLWWLENLRALPGRQES